MSQDFYEALDKLKIQQAGNTACIRSYAQAINDSMELAARMGVEAKAGMKVVGSNDFNDAKMIVDVDDETLRLIFGNSDQQSWNGEGLPPVGCVCEFNDNDGDNTWLEAEVIAYHEGFFWLNCSSGGRRLLSKDWLTFRPIRTYREKAIDAMYFDVAGVPATHDEMMNGDAWDCLAAAYDKGYRKQEPKL